MKKQIFAIIVSLMLSLIVSGKAEKEQLSRMGEAAAMSPKAQFTEWSTPVNLGPVINTMANDLAAALSRDERSLYFSSTRPGGFGGEDIWVSHRTSKNADWESPANLGPTINSFALERVRYLSPDGHLLLFQSDRGGGLGGSDIWASRRKGVDDDFGWETPVNLGSMINSTADEIGVDFLLGNEGRSDHIYFASDRPGGLGSADFYTSEILSDGSFGPPVNIAELSSPQHDSCLAVRSDGLEVILTSRRSSPLNTPSSADLWTSTRASVNDIWSPPVNLKAVNTEGFQDCCPSLSFDAMTLLFTSTRPGGFGGQDLYLARRQRRKGNQ
jgi:hypothetical protein